MTSANPSTSRRPQLVTALLVGAVVVVLGVASGLGVDTSTSATPAAPVTTVVTRTVPAPSPTRTPVQYIGVGTPVGAPPPNSVGTPIAASSAPAVTSTPAVSSAPSTSTSAPQPTTEPITCPQNLLTGLLQALLGTNGSGLLGGLLGGSGLLGGLLGTPSSAASGQDPVGGLFTTLTASTGANIDSSTDNNTGSLATSTGPAGLLAVVTQLLPTVTKSTGSPASAQLQPMATACTRQLSGTLPLLAGTR